MDGERKCQLLGAPMPSKTGLLPKSLSRFFRTEASMNDARRSIKKATPHRATLPMPFPRFFSIDLIAVTAAKIVPVFLAAGRQGAQPSLPMHPPPSNCWRDRIPA